MARKEKEPQEVAKRVDRNRNRAEFERAGLVHKGDGKEIDHIQPASRGGSNSRENLRVISESANRKKRDHVKGSKL
jgi:5-methylcytosine-specific restriction endonuclease McrA